MSNVLNFPRSIQLAWAAGIFDGEGTITDDRRHGRPIPTLGLTMTDEDTVRTFHEVVLCGGVGGPYSPKGGRSHTWRWSTARSDDVGAVLMTFYPLMSLRRQERIRTALTDWRHRPPSRRRFCRGKEQGVQLAGRTA